MKKYIIIIISFIFPVSVTFNVDMQEQILNSNGVHLAGADALTETSFGVYQDSINVLPWTAEDIEMLDVDYNGVYSAVLELDANTTYAYKFVNGIYGEDYELYNEEDRILETGNEDIALDIICFDKVDENCNEIDNSLVEVSFSVDMQEVDISENGVSILGSDDSFTNFGYDLNTLEPIPPYDPSSLNLTDPDGDEVFSVSIYLEPGVNYAYKFVNGNDWDNVEQTDRNIIISEVSGYTINEVCFNSAEDCPEFTTLIENLTFTTNVSNAVTNNGFELGDMLVVRWGFGETQTSEREDTLDLQLFSYDYTIDIDSIYISEDAGLYYQYYKILDDAYFREIFFNFEYDNNDIVLAERRFFAFDQLDNFGEVIIADDINSNVDPRRMPIFLNTDPIDQEIEIKWTIDLSPAYYQILAGDTLYDIQGTNHVTNIDSLLAWGVWINGPASMPANGESWTQWGITLQSTTSKKMWDDGTHGDDIAGDFIYTLELIYNEDTQTGQECKFGIKGGDNESAYGLNHYENINLSDPNIHIYWGSINPFFYDAWDFDLNMPNETEQCNLMDINSDGVINVVDIVQVVNIIFGTNNSPSEQEICAADANSDGQINVVDIVTIVNTILDI